MKTTEATNLEVGRRTQSPGRGSAAKGRRCSSATALLLGKEREPGLDFGSERPRAHEFKSGSEHARIGKRQGQDALAAHTKVAGNLAVLRINEENTSHDVELIHVDDLNNVCKLARHIGVVAAA